MKYNHLYYIHKLTLKNRLSAVFWLLASIIHRQPLSVEHDMAFIRPSYLVLRGPF